MKYSIIILFLFSRRDGGSAKYREGKGERLAEQVNHCQGRVSWRLETRRL